MIFGKSALFCKFVLKKALIYVIISITFSESGTVAISTLNTFFQNLDHTGVFMSSNRGSFSGKIGFVLAAAGSAVGLGNI